MRTYFEGKKELFTGLKIEELERENKRDKPVWFGRAFTFFTLGFINPFVVILIVI